MYTNRQLVSNYLQRDLTEHEVAMLMVINAAIKKWIDGKLATTFDKVGYTTRYYSGGDPSVDIDPCTSVSTVSLINDDGTTSFDYTTQTEYLAEPLNETVKTELVRRGGCWPSGDSRIAVRAKFSEWDGGVPEDIQNVATIVAAQILGQGLTATATGNVASESLEGHSISYDVSSVGIDKIVNNNPILNSTLELRRRLFV